MLLKDLLTYLLTVSET